MSTVETITAGGKTLAHVIRSASHPASTEFLTPPEAQLQMGFIVYGRGESITPHIHKPLERRLTGTPEALLVKSGKVRVDLYDDEKEPAQEVTLEQGEIILLLGGGHGFHMLEDTVLMEIKVGPYAGQDDKERF